VEESPLLLLLGPRLVLTEAAPSAKTNDNEEDTRDGVIVWIERS
jgi:hypothetical protein